MRSEKAGNDGSKSGLLYWSLQLAGWGGYFSLAAAGMYASDRRAIVLLVWLGIMLGHLAGSHALRFVIRRNEWLRLPVSKLLLRLLGVVSLFAVVVELFAAPVAALAGIATYRQQLSMYWFYVVASFILFSLWSLCYVAFVRYRESEMRTLRLKVSLREAELRALKSQVNPHRNLPKGPVGVDFLRGRGKKLDLLQSFVDFDVALQYVRQEFRQANSLLFCPS